MSETETHIGKLKKIECDSQNEYAHGIMKDKGEMPNSYDSPLEWMLNDADDIYISTPKGLYKVVKEKSLDSDDEINDLKENEDGTISFISRFYNGGTYLQEMLQEGLEKLGK